MCAYAPSRLHRGQVQPFKAGINFSLSPDKAHKWLHIIDEALHSRRLDAGAAQKLSGRLMWATQLLFDRVGRAMIKPIFAQKASKDGHVGPRLRQALIWWRNVIAHGVTETKPWTEGGRARAHIFVDAASTPARCAAVLFCDDEVWYTDGPPSTRLLDQLAARRDNQITSLVGSRFAASWFIFVTASCRRSLPL